MSRATVVEMPREIRFCVAYTGAVRRVLLIGEWPALTDVSAEMLANADPALLRREGDRLYFSAANGTAEYLIVEEDFARLMYRCARLYAQREDTSG